MKSGKRKQIEIDTRRRRKSEKKARAAKHDPRGMTVPSGVEFVICNPTLLAPYNSYGSPEFVERGYYVDMPFRCVGCGVEELWRATQQKWWYEVAKGNVESRAKRCRSCRRIERERSAQARRVHMEGIAAKRKRRAPIAK